MLETRISEVDQRSIRGSLFAHRARLAITIRCGRHSETKLWQPAKRQLIDCEAGGIIIL